MEVFLYQLYTLLKADKYNVTILAGKVSHPMKYRCSESLIPMIYFTLEAKTISQLSLCIVHVVIAEEVQKYFVSLYDVKLVSYHSCDPLV